MTDRSDACDYDACDYCGAPIGFYGCPRHGVDCYDSSKHDDDSDVADD